MEISKQQLKNKWSVGEIIRIINTDNTENQYEIIDHEEDTIFLRKMITEEHLKECAFRIFI